MSFDNRGMSPDELAMLLGNSLDLSNGAVGMIPDVEMKDAFEHCNVSFASPEDVLKVHRSLGQNSSHHELHFQYPCFDLLLAGSRPSFSYPRGIVFREAPQLNAFQIEAQDLNIAVRLNTPWSVRHTPGPPQLLGSTTLFEAVERVKLAPGISMLQIVSYFEGSDESQVKYCFRLLTWWSTAAGYPEPEDYYFININKHDFETLVEVCYGEEWVRTLHHLIGRSTDHAYLAVHHRMKEHNARMAARDMDILSPHWGRQKFVSANDVIFRRIKVLQHPKAGDVNHLAAVELPCGHRMLVNLSKVCSRWNEIECARFACDQCGSQVMRGNDILRLEFIADSCAREEFEKDEQEWKSFNKYIATDEYFLVRNFDFRRALEVALNSFNRPGSAMLYLISNINAKETKVIKDVLNKYLANKKRWEKISVSPVATCALLLKIALEALREFHGVDARDENKIYGVLPLNYNQFLHQWFKRGIMLAANNVKNETSYMMNSLDDSMINWTIQQPKGGNAFHGKKRADSMSIADAKTIFDLDGGQ